MAKSVLDSMENMAKRMDAELLTTEDFVNNWKMVVAEIQKLKLSNAQEIAAMRRHIEILSDKVSTDSKVDSSQAKQEALQELREFTQKSENRIAQMEARISTVQDGEDADEEVIVQKVLERIPPPAPVEISKMELPKLEIKPEDIPGLEQYIKQFIPMRSLGSAGWGAHPLTIKQSGTVKTKVARDINFTGATVTQNSDGSTTVAVTGGSGFTTLDATETPDGNRKVFTFAAASAQPTFIIVDNVWLRATTASGVVNWTWNGGTLKATLTTPANEEVLGIV